MDYAAELLKRDGWIQTKTIQEWIDQAEFRPAQFPSSLPALQILRLLGFGDELLQAKELG